MIVHIIGFIWLYSSYPIVIYLANKEIYKEISQNRQLRTPLWWYITTVLLSPITLILLLIVNKVR
jgi:SNF family Na+-dependent transporter